MGPPILARVLGVVWLVGSCWALEKSVRLALGLRSGIRSLELNLLRLLLLVLPLIGILVSKPSWILAIVVIAGIWFLPALLNLGAMRIAIGSCSCSGDHKRLSDREACEWIENQRKAWRSRLPQDLGAIPREQVMTVSFTESRMACTVRKEPLENGATLVVWSVFRPTWRWPNFISPMGTGRLFAEGLLVTSAGQVDDAPDDLMWQFR